MLEKFWRVTLCGGLSARRGTHIVARFRTQKTGLLLAYLTLHSERTHGREELAELFWPDSDQPLSNLRMALAALRQQLESASFKRGDILTASRTHVSLVPDVVRTDVMDFHTAVGQAARVGEPGLKTQLLRQGVDAISGELLPGSYMD